MTGIDTKSAAATSEISPATWRLAWVVAFGAFASGLDTSLINIALKTVQDEFGTGLRVAQWVSSAYLLALAVSLPGCAWLGRRVGVGRLWLGALAAFTVISALCAAAPSMEVLIGLRVLQGLTAGLLVPAGQTVLGQAVGPGRLGRVMARLGVAVVLAPAIGPFLGGLMLHSLSWRWLFLINVPIGAVALMLGLRWIPHEKGTATTPLDWAGFSYVGIGLPLVVLGLTDWGSDGSPKPLPVLLPLGLGAAGLVVFVLHATRREHPLLDMSLYRSPGYSTASVAFLFNGALTFGCALVFPLYFQMLHGDSVVETGLQMLSMGAGTGIMLPLGGRLTDRYGSGPIAVLGTGCAVVATTTFAFVGSDPSPVLVQALLLLLGMGTGTASTPLVISAFTTVPRERLPEATAQINILARLGGALGAALYAVVLARGLPGGTRHAFHVAFQWQCGTALAALAGTLLLWLTLHRAGASSLP
ncbi:DHA2 family efflux MFS transporter permease subunit [Streptomyces cocklensis]|uniref:Drug resistance transporter, EmrB/QacA subfamily n=1 Tax=Actinacidiphila cocklensis TaxID=887465 RepID=A0A9W4GPT3_9ACTN|nr:DHA2 family efflux MFS transporter permease subunit [Actinacidiphila cocklensis]MDD1058678.1 DHA2 family efflux MFS transporter permease subunit [Actinacidiphila cocklensis]CAG6390864.1 Drug resistance transporter, EmrB/QacA subfamily [Actinacidiphila cocklensis]